MLKTQKRMLLYRITKITHDGVEKEEYIKTSHLSQKCEGYKAVLVKVVKYDYDHPILPPSPIKYHVKKAITIIPDPNPIKRPGQSNPSNPSTTYLEAKIKRYEIGTPHKAIMSLCSRAHSHMN